MIKFLHIYFFQSIGIRFCLLILKQPIIINYNLIQLTTHGLIQLCIRIILKKSKTYVKHNNIKYIKTTTKRSIKDYENISFDSIQKKSTLFIIPQSHNTYILCLYSV